MKKIYPFICICALTITQNASAQECKATISYQAREFYDSWMDLVCPYQFAILDVEAEKIAFRSATGDGCNLAGSTELEPGRYMVGSLPVGLGTIIGNDNTARLLNDIPIGFVPFTISSCESSVSLNCTRERRFVLPNKTVCVIRESP